MVVMLRLLQAMPLRLSYNADEERMYEAGFTFPVVVNSVEAQYFVTRMITRGFAEWLPQQPDSGLHLVRTERKR